MKQVLDAIAVRQLQPEASARNDSSGSSLTLRVTIQCQIEKLFRTRLPSGRFAIGRSASTPVGLRAWVRWLELQIGA